MFLTSLQAPDVDSDLFVEVLGILVNVDIPSYDWAALIAQHDLLNLLAGQPACIAINACYHVTMHVTINACHHVTITIII